jgi:hypothetical protein
MLSTRHGEGGTKLHGQIFMDESLGLKKDPRRITYWLSQIKIWLPKFRNRGLFTSGLSYF